MSYIAICENLADTVWASGKSELEACASLWERVSQYLKDRQAPHTAEMNAEELNEYFGCVVIDLSKKGGLLRN